MGCWVSRREPGGGGKRGGIYNTLTRLPRHVLQPLYLPLTPTMVVEGDGGRWFQGSFCPGQSVTLLSLGRGGSEKSRLGERESDVWHGTWS